MLETSSQEGALVFNFHLLSQSAPDIRKKFKGRIMALKFPQTDLFKMLFKVFKGGEEGGSLRSFL